MQYSLFMKRNDSLHLLVGDASESDKKDLLSELELMKQLKPHLFVVKLLGCVTKSGT